MKRTSSHHQISRMRTVTLSQLPPLTSSTLPSGYECHKGIARRRGSDPSQEVGCLTIAAHGLSASILASWHGSPGCGGYLRAEFYLLSCLNANIYSSPSSYSVLFRLDTLTTHHISNHQPSAFCNFNAIG